MKRLKEEYLEKIDKVVSFANCQVLEVGCGSGTRSVAIADKCQHLEAIEPDPNTIQVAKSENGRSNINYQLGQAEKLNFADSIFDVVFFTLSLHHVPVLKMGTAIEEAVRVTKSGGHVIFLEPAFTGTYFESEILFDAGCGDERAEKARAYFELLRYKKYTEVVEIDDETVFKLDSVEDYIQTFKPKKNFELLPDFLEKYHFLLNAKRRINIFRV